MSVSITFMPIQSNMTWNGFPEFGHVVFTKRANPLKKILVNVLLAGMWALAFAALFYNAIEYSVFDLNFAGFVGFGFLLAVFIHAIITIRYAIRSFRNKRFGAMTAYLLITVALFLIARMGAYVTLLHFVGTVGGH